MNNEAKVVVEEAFRDSLKRLLEVKVELSEAAAAELNMLVDDILPLVVEQTRALLSSESPEVARAYLKVLSGAVEANAARLGLRAVVAQRNALGDLAGTIVQVLAIVVRTAGLLM